jgi:hypothetical protein
MKIYQQHHTRVQEKIISPERKGARARAILAAECIKRDENSTFLSLESTNLHNSLSLQTNLALFHDIRALMYNFWA